MLILPETNKRVEIFKNLPISLLCHVFTLRLKNSLRKDSEWHSSLAVNMIVHLCLAIEERAFFHSEFFILM